jgi:hypothetical protein
MIEAFIWFHPPSTKNKKANREKAQILVQWLPQILLPSSNAPLHSLFVFVCLFLFCFEHHILLTRHIFGLARTIAKYAGSSSLLSEQEIKLALIQLKKHSSLRQELI